MIMTNDKDHNNDMGNINDNYNLKMLIIMIMIKKL